MTEAAGQKSLVKVDEMVNKIMENWTSGLHRQTCYGDITKDLRFSADSKTLNDQ